MERQNGLGKEIVYADQKGVRITYPNAGMNILSKPPTWDVTWFSPQSHNMP
jgi:hypothetical protein